MAVGKGSRHEGRRGMERWGPGTRLLVEVERGADGGEVPRVLGQADEDGRLGGRWVVSAPHQIELDADEQLVYVGGELLSLDRREYLVAAYLFRNPRRLLSREQILLAAWGRNATKQNEQIVQKYVSLLRQHLETALGKVGPRLIRTERDGGYRFWPEAE